RTQRSSGRGSESTYGSGEDARNLGCHKNDRQQEKETRTETRAGAVSVRLNKVDMHGSKPLDASRGLRAESMKSPRRAQRTPGSPKTNTTFLVGSVYRPGAR